MLGAIIGDIVGSRFELSGDWSKDFTLFTKDCCLTDDTVLSLAVAKALLELDTLSNLSFVTEKCMRELGHRYPGVGWGGRFKRWLFEDGYELKDSYGNGAAMRISPVAWVANNLDEVKLLSGIITRTTHGHVEGVKGAEAIAVAVYLARTGKNKKYIREKMSEYYPQLKNKDFNIEYLLNTYKSDKSNNWVTCQGSVPQALVCFLDSVSFEDTIRNAVGIGGDTDTLGAMAGGIAEAYYGIPKEMHENAMKYLWLHKYLRNIYLRFYIKYISNKMEEVEKVRKARVE